MSQAIPQHDRFRNGYLGLLGQFGRSGQFGFYQKKRGKIYAAALRRRVIAVMLMSEGLHEVLLRCCRAPSYAALPHP
jgi:hypothetical protein